MEPFDLKRGLLLGAAGGGTRTDGGNLGHTWNDWYARGKLGAADPARAAMHWERWREDVALMRRVGLETCRFTAEWARLEPEQGVFDQTALERVREELLLMRAMGIRPVLVLHEFTEPMWFARLGGWTKADNVDYFLGYAERLVRTVGHLVSDYVVLSQPNLYAMNGWCLGAWPPGEEAPRQAAKVMSALAAAHIECYKRLHEVRRELGFTDTRVGASAYMRSLTPQNKKSPLRMAGAGAVDKLFQTSMLEAMLLGKFSGSVKDVRHNRRGLYSDFHDLCFYGLSAAGRNYPTAGRETTPEELIHCAAKLSALLRRPIFITEGTGFKAPSPERLHAFLSAVCRSGLPVERYFSLAFTDGFEWERGERNHLGLVRVDYRTGERSITPGGEFYARVIRNRGVTEEMCAQYAPAE